MIVIIMILEAMYNVKDDNNCNKKIKQDRLKNARSRSSAGKITDKNRQDKTKRKIWEKMKSEKKEREKIKAKEIQPKRRKKEKKIRYEETENGR